MCRFYIYTVDVRQSCSFFLFQVNTEEKILNDLGNNWQQLTEKKKISQLPIKLNSCHKTKHLAHMAVWNLIWRTSWKWLITISLPGVTITTEDIKFNFTHVYGHIIRNWWRWGIGFVQVISWNLLDVLKRPGNIAVWISSQTRAFKQHGWMAQFIRKSSLPDRWR